MKKYFSLTIVFILMMMLASMTASAYSATEYDYELYEDFEDGNLANWNMGGPGTQYSITAVTDDGYGGSKGCAKIAHTGTSTNSSELHIVPGRTYRISGYMKLTEEMDAKYNSNKYVSFIYMTKDDSIYIQVNHEYLPLSTTDWTRFQIDYAYNGYLRANKPYVGEADIKVVMRTCDPTISFLLDDFSIEVIAENGNAVVTEDEENQKLVKQGNFETDFNSALWTVQDGISNVENCFFGANNTMSALSLDMQAGSKFGQTVATQTGSAYSGEFYVKSTNDVKLIANDGASDFEIPLTKTASDDWTKCEFESPYTATSTETKFYFTTDSSEASSFVLDEFSIKSLAADTVLKAKDVSVSGKFMTNETITFNWGYTLAHEGDAVIKVFRKYGDGWAGFDNFVADAQTTSYSINLTEDMVGTQFKIDIMPINQATGVTAKEISYVTSQVYGTFDVKATFDTPSENITANFQAVNFSADEDVLVVLCLYNNKDAMIAVASEYVDLKSNTKKAVNDIVSCVKTADAVRAEVFIWKGTSISNNTMVSLVDCVELDIE